MIIIIIKSIMKLKIFQFFIFYIGDMYGFKLDILVIDLYGCPLGKLFCKPHFNAKYPLPLLVVDHLLKPQ